MSTQVETTPTVDKEIERLARKYPAVVDEVQGLMAQLEHHRPGDRYKALALTYTPIRYGWPTRRRDAANAAGFELSIM